MALSVEQAADRSDRLRVLRQRAGYSMNDLALAMGLSGQSSIQRYLAADYLHEFHLDIARPLIAAFVGKGNPEITEEDVRFVWPDMCFSVPADLGSVRSPEATGRHSAETILAVAASQWDGVPTPQQIIRALAAGGFRIVEIGDGAGQSAEIQMSGAEIRAPRERLGWSQDDLAERSGSTQQTVDRIEKDQTEFSRARPAIIKVLKDNRIDATDDPRGFVQEIINRRNIKPTTLAKQVGLAVSTLNRFLKGGNPSALLSTRTLQKIKEWDNVQGVVPDAIGNPTGFVLEIMARRDLSPSALAVGAGVNPSTLTRALNDPDHKFQLSTTTLQKINEWDRAQTFGAKCGVPT